MKPAKAASLVFLIAVMLAPSSHATATWYGGGGVVFGSIDSEETTFADGTEGSSFILNGGLRFNPLLSMDLVLSGQLTSDLFYSILSLGPRIDFMDLKEKKVAPWAALYLSHHSLDWEDTGLGMDGLGISAAVGLDLAIRPNGIIQWAVRHHEFEADLKAGGVTLGRDLESTTTEVSVSYIFHYWE